MSEPVELVVYQGRGEEHREPSVGEVIEWLKAKNRNTAVLSRDSLRSYQPGKQGEYFVMLVSDG